MIDRLHYLDAMQEALSVHNAVAVLGPRQCGKTTLARAFVSAETDVTFFDLESPVDVQKLTAPMQTLGGLTGIVVIDEVQRKPELFEILRVLLDRENSVTKFIILGSASQTLVKGASESLAGRIGYVDLSGFDIREISPGQQSVHWNRGGFPRAFLAKSDDASSLWRESFIRSFLERDIPQLGISVPAETLRRFWMMVCHYHGQVWNASEFARSLGASEGTARRYLDILAGSYVVRVLPPWFENVKKRQVKSPKIYVKDSGLLHTFLGLKSLDDLLGHHKLGASWEGYAIEQVLACLPGRDMYFWGTHAGAELDLMVNVRGKKYGFEFKYSDAPSSTRSMRVALEDLGLEHLWVVYPGADEYAIDNQITVVPLQHIPNVSAKLL